MLSAYLLLGITSFIPAILADRGSAPNIIPTACNTEPTATAASSTPTPTCQYAADADGAMGLCPNLSNGGWCDCGTDGDYPTLTGSAECAYTSLPASTLSLSSTSCVSSTTTNVQTVTVVPVASTNAQKRAEPTYTGIPDRRRASRLHKRQGTITFSNCGDSPGGAWVKAGFATMEAVLQQAYKDAVTLASASQDVAIDNVGFTHYFGGALLQDQLTHFQHMMKAITSTTNYYSVQFECKNVPDCSAGGSAMVTDVSAGGPDDVKVIEVCPRFWTGASTTYLLYDAAHTTPNPPYRNNDGSNNGWCAKRTTNGDPNVSFRINQHFATAGHTVLHELMHVSSLAQQAGLQADAENKYGTLDAQGGCELAGARDFLADYNAGDTDETSPDYNAESYAAAATEIYFMQLCGFSQIKPYTS